MTIDRELLAEIKEYFRLSSQESFTPAEILQSINKIEYILMMSQREKQSKNIVEGMKQIFSNPDLLKELL